MIAIVFTEQHSISELVRWEFWKFLQHRDRHGRTRTRSASSARYVGSALDHIIIFNESSLKRILKTYFEYYEDSRTHLSLEKDAPASRTVQHPELGSVIALPQVGGLHHRYERRAA